MFRQLLISSLLSGCCYTQVSAQITLDGTLGRAGALPGPNYQIGANLGQQQGGNLFHSFRDFNLQSHESATFSGPANVQNVISRVTGGNPSSIDGTLRSTIPKANLYFLNPFGIMFGPNAKLDVQGSFYASTADYLRLSDGGRFEARTPSNSLLTVAPVEAFGFLTDSPATLDLQESQLTVPGGQTFSLTGGNLSLNGAQLNAPGGPVTFTSLAQAGQIALTNSMPLTVKGGTIKLQNQSKVSTSGLGGGKVLIRGGQLVMDNSVLEANTLGNQDGKGIDIATDESVTVKGDVVAMGTPTFGPGKGGDIQITTPRLEVTGSFIDTSSLGSGRSGNIEVQAQQIKLTEGAKLLSWAFGRGEGGNITITASDFLSIMGRHYRDFNLHGVPLKQFVSLIGTNSFGISRAGDIMITVPDLRLAEGGITADCIGPSDAGNLTIQAHNASLQAGSFIASNTTWGQHGGTITVTVTDTLTISGYSSGAMYYLTGQVFRNLPSAIASASAGAGQAGRIIVSAGRLFLLERGVISTGTIGSGVAGLIQVTADEIQIHSSGAISNSSNTLFVNDQWVVGTGPSGNITVNANNLLITTDGAIAANSLGTGTAGNLVIRANTIRLLDKGLVITSAAQAAGGNIHLTATNLLYLDDSQISTSVGGGQGNGGNITLDNPQFMVLNKAQIKAQAVAGHGGNIRVIAEQFLKTPDSLVSASSRLGINGTVTIRAPNETVSNSLNLPPALLDVTNRLPKLCRELSEEEYDNLSHFFVHPRAITGESPDDLQGGSV